MGGGLQFVTVRTDSSAAGLRGPTLACHTAEDIHGGRVQRSEVITEKDVKPNLHFTIRQVSEKVHLFRLVLYLLKVSKTTESSQLMASGCPGGRHKSPTSMS